MLNSYNPYNVMSLDMSSKDKDNNKAYIGTRIFPVSFYMTTDNGAVIPYSDEGTLDYPLYSQLIESQNYAYSEAQLENKSLTKVTSTETTTVRTGSFLVVPWLLNYGLDIWDLYDAENMPDLYTEMVEIRDYAATNNLVLNTNIGESKTGCIIGIAADGTLHALALDLQAGSIEEVI